MPLGLAGLLFSFLYRPIEFRETFRYSLQGLSLIPVFVCAVRFPSWGPMRPLNFRPIAFLGELSYSLYLLHHVMLFSVEDRLPGLGPAAEGVVAFGATLVLALVMRRFVEKPCARLRQRLRA